MNDETLVALKGSITKWEKIVAGIGADLGGANCPLCQRFNTPPSRGCGGEEPHCLWCPVMQQTGLSACVKTPYYTWVKHHNTKHMPRSSFRVVPGCAECERLAQAELDFLKSLLPKETP